MERQRPRLTWIGHASWLVQLDGVSLLIDPIFSESLGPGTRLYHSGDTAYYDGFAEIARRAGPIDAALLPIGAYDPAWFMSKQHMNPEEAARAFTDLGARTFVAMHWGTFKLTDEPLDEPPARLTAEWQRRGLDPATCHIPPIGGTLQIARPSAV